MNIQVETDQAGQRRLKRRVPNKEVKDWNHVISGYWDDSPNHSGRISYWLARTSRGFWALECKAGRTKRIVALCEDAPSDINAKEMAKILYAAVEENDGVVVDEPTDFGLLTW